MYFQHCGTNWGHCKLKLTQIKLNVGFLRSGENQSTRGKTGVPGEKLEYPGKNWSTRGKTGIPGEKLVRAEKRTNKLSPHMTPSLGIEPGAHCHERNALTTTLQEKKIAAEPS